MMSSNTDESCDGFSYGFPICFTRFFPLFDVISAESNVYLDFPHFSLFLDSSSDDSDSDLRVKNVSRLVMRPIGHSGKAKRGHLVFDAAYESGIITNIH